VACPAQDGAREAVGSVEVLGCEAFERGGAVVIAPGELRDPADWLVHGLLGDPQSAPVLASTMT
jgi:hypothetical protein